MSRYKDCGRGRALLRRFEFTLEATGGKDTSDGVFEHFLGPGFSEHGIVFDSVVPETEIVVDELVIDDLNDEFVDGDFKDVIGTALEFEKHRFTGSQLLAISKFHFKKLLKEGSSNFFVLTKGDEPVSDDLSNVVVVTLMVGPKRAGSGFVEGLYVWIRPLSEVDVGYAEDGSRFFSREQ